MYEESIVVLALNEQCDICKADNLSNLKFTSCCFKLYHVSCVVNNCLCPNCNLPYKLVYILPYINKLNAEKIHKIYSTIFHQYGHDTLINIDLRYGPASMVYPVSLFTDIFSFKNQFQNETHGIFDNFQWKNFITCGSYLSKLYHHQQSNDTLYFILYSNSYPIIRERLIYFTDYLRNRFMLDDDFKIPVTVKSNTIYYYLPGLTRGIALKVIFNNNLTDLLYIGKHRTNGIFYDGDKLQCTISGINTKKSFCNKPVFNYSLKYNESINQFRQRTGLKVIDTDVLLTNVFGVYSLVINLDNNFPTQQKILKEWYVNSRLTQMVNIDLNENTFKYEIYLITPHQTKIPYQNSGLGCEKITLILHNIYKFIENHVYMIRDID